MTAMATAAEKLEQLLQEKRNNSYQGRAILEMEQENVGRFRRKPTDPSPLPVYPALPENSPWHHDPVPMEEPLGYSVEDVLPVGELFEVEASIQAIESASAVATVGTGVETGLADPSTLHHPDVDRGPVSPQSQRLIRRSVR